jgi:tRNA(Phe) wybutosine-synthesizing methylase Tyw3
MNQEKTASCCCDGVRVEIRSAEKGVTIHVETEDPEKAKSLQNLSGCCSEGSKESGEAPGKCCGS